jgi:hypothetical protein
MQKKITPVMLWKNGLTTTASYLNLILVKDDLNNHSVFHYALLSEVDAPVILDIELPDASTPDYIPAPAETVKKPGSVLAEGNISLDDEDYASWDGTNDWIMNWVANKLSLTIL